jgi:proteasome accessory factor B
VKPQPAAPRVDTAYERKMRLYAFLAEHERWHALRDLLTRVHGYLNDADAREIALRGITPPELETAFNSARKKLTRDLDDLERLGFIVEQRELRRDTTGETTVVYRLSRDSYASSEIELSPEQLGVLAVAAALAKSAPDFPIAEDALAALEKLLPGKSLGSGLPVSVSFKVPRTERNADVLNSRLHRLALIMRRRHVVEFDYHKLDGTNSRREVELYGLGDRVGLWYAVGRDLADGRIKSFRVSRMHGRPAEQKADQGPQYQVPADFDLADHIRPPWRIGDTETVVTVAFGPQVVHLARAMLCGAPARTLPDGRTEFIVPVLNVDGLVRWLMTFGDSADVLAPESARAYANDMAARMEAQRG